MKGLLKNSMKKSKALKLRPLIKRPLYCLLLVSLSLLSGCKICSSEDCVHGDCRAGRCVCEEGWSGSECDQPVKGRFDRLYSASDRCYWTDYGVKIIGGKGGHDLRIIGLHGQMDTLYGDNDKDLENWFNIPNQAI